MKHFCLAAALALAGVAHAQPLEFKGVPFGSPPSALRQLALTQAHSFSCDAPEEDARLCELGGMTYANHRAKRVVAFFMSGRLSQITVETGHEAHSDTLRALTEAFGAPQTTTRLPLRTRNGATWDQVLYGWTTKAGDIISAKRYGADIDTSVVVLTSAEAISRQRATPATKAKKDI